MDFQVVLCVKNDNYPASLEVRKVYQAMPDERAAALHLVRIIDESGEGYLYPDSYFIPIELPQAAVNVFVRAWTTHCASIAPAAPGVRRPAAEGASMDKLERYRDIVRRLIEEYASYKPSNGQIDTEAIVDREHDHYEVMHVGWDGPRRVHGSVVHLDIIDGKVWLQYDGPSRPVADELLAAGIPREDIVLAFHPARVRPLTGFAVG